jgi:hypothetical protein
MRKNIKNSCSCTGSLMNDLFFVADFYLIEMKLIKKL